MSPASHGTLSAAVPTPSGFVLQSCVYQSFRAGYWAAAFIWYSRIGFTSLYCVGSTVSSAFRSTSPNPRLRSGSMTGLPLPLFVLRIKDWMIWLPVASGHFCMASARYDDNTAAAVDVPPLPTRLSPSAT